MPTWLQILLTGVTAAIINQMLGWLKDNYRDKAKVEVDRRYIALRLTVVLERFAIQCADQIAIVESELQEAYKNGVAPDHHSMTIPPLRLPEGDDWRWISADLASDILAIPPQIDFSKGAISWSWEVGDPEGAAKECQLQLALRGLECWELAVKVRQQHKIAPAKFDMGSWAFIEVMRKHAGTHKK